MSGQDSSNTSLAPTQEIPVGVRQRALVNAAGVAARLGASQAELAEVLGALGLLTLDETLRATGRLAHSRTSETPAEPSVLASEGRNDPSGVSCTAGHPIGRDSLTDDGQCAVCVKAEVERRERRRVKSFKARNPGEPIPVRRDPLLCYKQLHVRTERNMRRARPGKGTECRECEKDRRLRNKRGGAR